MTHIDTHVHIDFYSDPMKIALQYESLKIYTLFVTNLPEIFNKHLNAFNNFKYVRLCLGYHPQVASEYELDKAMFQKLVKKTKYIGEVGLDFQNETEMIIERQKDAFKFITSKNFNQGRVYSIHSKGTEDIVLKTLKENEVKHAIFHWYSGKLTTADKIIDMGYYFSVNSKMLGSKNGCKLIQRIPKERILFETDGPFALNNKKVVYPQHIKNIYSDFNQVIPGFEEIVFNNFRRLLLEKDLY
ncbi:TatD family hydrolase [Planococcus sp. SSTMD024]|uniref:TatD family hydrolase n=1 Tax=Planococcus sp. SSTMD024 TaxID=3242163 RepID=UPI00351DDC65